MVKVGLGCENDVLFEDLLVVLLDRLLASGERMGTSEGRSQVHDDLVFLRLMELFDVGLDSCKQATRSGTIDVALVALAPQLRLSRLELFLGHRVGLLDCQPRGLSVPWVVVLDAALVELCSGKEEPAVTSRLANLLWQVAFEGGEEVLVPLNPELLLLVLDSRTILATCFAGDLEVVGHFNICSVSFRL